MKLRFLALAVSGSLAAACGGNGTSPTADSSSATSSASSGTDPSATPVTDPSTTPPTNETTPPTLMPCDSTECAPQMCAPNYLCADGTMGGPGPCMRNANGQCGWSYRTCEIVTRCDTCVLSGAPATACSAPYVGFSGPSGMCVIQPDGTCAELMLTCYLP